VKSGGTTRLVVENDPNSVDYAGYIAEYGENDVDGQLDVAAFLHQDSQRRQDESQDELENIRAGAGHDFNRRPTNKILYA